jgi:hypothetical protein
VPNPITTTGLSSGSVATNFQSGQTTRDWIESHNAGISAQWPSGNSLKTTWTSVAGPEEVTTVRWPDETDAAFMVRHKGDYVTAMTGALPVP